MESDVAAEVHADFNPATHAGHVKLAGDCIGVSHFGVAVADMERSLRFYRDLLGLEVMVDRLADQPYLRALTGMEFDAIRITFLRVLGTHTFVELLQHKGMDRTAIRSRLCDPGNAHLCLYVDDIEAIQLRLVGAGVTVLSQAVVSIDAGPFVGSRALFVLDPDGVPVEINQPAAGGLPALASALATLPVQEPRPGEVAAS